MVPRMGTEKRFALVRGFEGLEIKETARLPKVSRPCGKPGVSERRINF